MNTSNEICKGCVNVSLDRNEWPCLDCCEGDRYNEPQPEADRPKQIPAVIGCISASMIIEYTDHSEHYQCPSRICKSEQQNIDTYYSELHAHKFGWKKTSDIMFCPPDKKYVWVCPSCAKEHEWFR